MLEALRRFVGSWVAKIFLGILIASFAVWGIASGGFGPGSSNAVATVGETTVPPARLRLTYRNAHEAASQRVGRRLTQEQARLLGVEQQAISQVISGATLDEYGRRLGIRLSEEELGRLIAQQRQFLDSQGRFDIARFEDAARQAELSRESFVEEQNVAALRAQIGNATVAGELMPDVYERAAATFANERRVADVATITAAEAGTPSAPTNAQLAAFFEANRTSYRAPQYRKVALLKLEPADIADPAAVDPQAVAADYEARRARYTTPERRTIQQLRFNSRADAEAARKALDEGALFESVLAEYEINPETIELGTFARDAVPDPAIRDAAFALPLNAPSDVIDGRFGPVIVRAVAIEPEVVRPQAEVESEIRETLARQDAAARISDLYAVIEDARAGGATVEEVARANDLQVRVIDALDADGRGADGAPIAPALPAPQSLVAEVFRTDPGAPTNALELGTAGYVWFDVLGVEEERDRTLDEVRDRVTADWTAAEQAKLLDAKAEEIAAAARGVEPLAAVTAAQRTEPFGRNANLPLLGREGVEAAFAGPVGHVAVTTPAPGTRNVLEVVRILPPEEAELPEAVADNVNRGVANDLLTQVIVRLQSEYGATVNRPLIQSSLNRL